MFPRTVLFEKLQNINDDRVRRTQAVSPMLTQVEAWVLQMERKVMIALCDK